MEIGKVMGVIADLAEVVDIAFHTVSDEYNVPFWKCWVIFGVGLRERMPEAFCDFRCCFVFADPFAVPV